ncbi:MAG: transketolase [Clostridiales Family XIII bacterium]|jgi:transketolase|nr:transketolase [Clostridiales Family XIII bacterium]
MDLKLAVNAIRVLAADEVQAANSGHPGFPLGAAPIVYELYANHLKHNPADPEWFDRDRFVLSAGHGSAMLYAVLHLFGYEGLTVDQLKNFRQFGSLTPGHPEYRHTKGVDATTGPLGAGLGMAVGMAMAEAHLAKIFNRPGQQPLVDHYTYALCGDGCLMEGISSEVMSLAGTLGLSKLIVLYDSNRITIEGSTELAFTEDVTKRFEAFGFGTFEVADGNDTEAIGRAVEAAKTDTKKPSFIKIHTHIGYGVPAKQDSASAHGEPLGEENVRILREKLGWPLKEAFSIPQEVYDHYAEKAGRGVRAEEAWEGLRKEYAARDEAAAVLFEQYLAREITEEAKGFLSETVVQEKAEATRAVSGNILNGLKESLPWLIGGSADLAPSNKTYLKDEIDFSAGSPGGRNIHFGVRELGMGAICLGLALHGGVVPYCATFLVFSDYVKPMIRLAALMQLPVLYVFTHDSIGVGEDGPTHEPVEQLTMLRSVPGLDVFRPCDTNETKAAYLSALTSGRPTVLALSRQNLAPVGADVRDALNGGYILEIENGEEPEVILIATGSEVAPCVAAKKLLAGHGIDARVVSIPSLDIFLAQPEAYQADVLPKAVRKRVVVEAGSRQPWGEIAGLDGAYVTMDGFGASAPADRLFAEYGFTAEHIAEVAAKL